MIFIADKIIFEFIEHLNEKYQTKEICKITFLHNYTTVAPREHGNNSSAKRAFAAYDPNTRTIYLPMDAPEEIMDDASYWMLHNLAHEFKHFLDDINGIEDLKEMEKNADEFADVELHLFFNEKESCKE